MKKKEKPLNFKDPKAPMTLLDAEKYLRSIKEWDDVAQMDREIIIKLHKESKYYDFFF